MGNYLTCGGQCDQCTKERCLILANEHVDCPACRTCSSMCLGSRSSKHLVHTMTAVSDGAQPPQEEYTLPGSDCPQSVCFGPPDGEEGLMEESLPGHHGDSDQVYPLADEPGGSDLPNVSWRMDIVGLEDECRYNAGKLKKVHRLAEAYGHWRSIRGDGNCYYRTVVFGTLEALIAKGDRVRIRQLAGFFGQVSYENLTEQRGHEQMLRRLSGWDSLTQLEQWVAKDACVDQALIRASRRLVRIYLVRNAERKTPSGLTYSELVRALDGEYADVEDFCARVVDPMGRDAETLVLDALPRQLGIGLRLWILDRRDEIDLVSLDTPGPDGKVDVHVLFKPGHYDLLYPREAAAAFPAVATAHSVFAKQ